MAQGNKERLLRNLPPGVVLGSDFRPKKGFSIETQGHLWALNTRELMPQLKLDLCIIHKDNAGFFELPAINQVFKGGHLEKKIVALWVPRYDPVSGAVYITRWTKPETSETKGGKGLIDNQDFIAFAGRKYSPDKAIDLSKFPKSWTVARLIPQKIEDGLEFALRQQDEISWDYSTKKGVEEDTLHSLFANIFSYADEIKSDTEIINQNYLDQLSEKTEELLFKLGFDKPSGEFRKRVAHLLQKSVKVDSIGRVNPMISRVLLRSAYLEVTKMEVLNRFVRSKSEKVFNLLWIEREVTRAQVSDSIEAIGKLAGLGKNPGLTILTEDYYRSCPRKISDEQILSTVSIIRAISRRSLEPIKVEPYLLPVRLSQRLLTDINMKRVADRERILNTLQYYNIVPNEEILSAEEYIKKRDPSKTVERLRQVHSLLSELIDDPDNKVYTVFSEM
jgi:hypothetical protein